MNILLLVGAFLPLPYVFYVVIQTMRKRTQISGLGVLLAYIAILVPIGLFTWGTLSGNLEPIFTPGVIVSAAVVLLFGIILMVREWRQPGRGLNRSYGTLSVGVSALLIVGLVLSSSLLNLLPNAGTASAAGMAGGGFPAGMQLPEGVTLPEGMTIPEGMNIPAGGDANADAGGESAFPAAPAGFSLGGSAAQPAADASPTPPPTLQPTTALATRTLLPTITPTLSATATPLATAAAPTPVLPTCDALVIYNLNLRAEPSADAQLLTTIPYGTTVSGTEITDDNWWRVTYDGQDGWVSGEYLSVLGACEI
jgi:hypothetical protein